MALSIDVNTTYFAPGIDLTERMDIRILNICFLTVIFNVLRRKCNKISSILTFHNILVCIRKFNRKNISYMQISIVFTLWITVLNLILIVICNPTICNPGPKPKLSVLYQNVRGLIPPSYLGLPNPVLNVDKIAELQTYIMDKKPDIVILNETWLSKNINGSEILPSQVYKFFRLDRSQKTHPIDPTNPDKFRKNGGGVLIAIITDLNCESSVVTLKCKAEILSVEVSLGNGKYICLSTFYRVGTLGAENHRAVDSYLRNLAMRNKYSNMILIGDINLNQVTWPLAGNINNRIQAEFLETFDDLNFDQLIETPTHKDDKTLDLLLTNSPQIISNIVVKSCNEVCKSDHFAIEFLLDKNISRKKPVKRKVFNFKKVNWSSLNDSLRYFKWNSFLKNCDTETAWYRFKSKLLELCHVHILTITIK